MGVIYLFMCVLHALITRMSMIDGGSEPLMVSCPEYLRRFFQKARATAPKRHQQATKKIPGPGHKAGRADYFGKDVGRASRVAAAAAPGATCLGIPMSEEGRSSLQAVLPGLGPDIRSTFIGARRVKGPSNEISLFSCADLRNI